MTYNYFIPMIHLGPMFSYKYSQELPLSEIKNLIVGEKADFEIKRKVFLNSNLIFDKTYNLKFKNNEWINEKKSKFEWGPWCEQNDISYIETHMNLLSGKGLKSCSIPTFYVNYTSENKKNFISCGQEKYGNPRVIMQMKEFGKWIDGYPAININHKNNITYSLILVNPYNTTISLTLEINNLKLRKNIKVAPLCVKRLKLNKIIKEESWTGQIYIYGKRRAILYVMNHALNDFNKISTLEHGDPFRAELTYQPKFQYLRNLLHKKIKKYIN